LYFSACSTDENGSLWLGYFSGEFREERNRRGGFGAERRLERGGGNGGIGNDIAAIIGGGGAGLRIEGVSTTKIRSALLEALLFKWQLRRKLKRNVYLTFQPFFLPNYYKQQIVHGQCNETMNQQFYKKTM